MIILKANSKLKEVALIFDDGPNPKVTPKLLEVLKKKGVPANFFLIGKRAEEYPEIVKQIAKDGHELGNHSYTHKRLNQILQEKGEKAVREEIEKGTLAIKNAANLSDSDIKFFRPPYLNWSKELAIIAAPLYENRIIMSKLVIGDYGWGGDHYWDDKDRATITKFAGQIVKAWQSETKNGTILAFHDSAEYSLEGNTYYETWMNRALPTLEAVPKIIDYLINKGFVIKKLSDMKLAFEEIVVH